MSSLGDVNMKTSARMDVHDFLRQNLSSIELGLGATNSLISSNFQMQLFEIGYTDFRKQDMIWLKCVYIATKLLS